MRLTPLLASTATIKDAPGTTTTRKSGTGAVRRLRGAAEAEPGWPISGDHRRSRTQSLSTELRQPSTNRPSPSLDPR